MANPQRGLFRGVASTTAHREVHFLLGDQRGCSQPPRCLLPPQSAPPPPPSPSGRPYLEEPVCQLARCGASARKATGSAGPAGALGWVQLPQAWCLDLDPAEPVVRGVACELSWPGRKPQTQTMLGLTSGYRPGPHRLGDPDRPLCPVGMGQLSLPHPNMRQLQWVDPTDPGRLTTKARDQPPACVGHL